jgi:hypothetical protein
VLPACAIVFLVLLNSVLDYGHQTDVCIECGAGRTSSHFYFLRIGGRYDIHIDEGPVSRLIQAHTGQRCAHAWLLCSGTWGGRRTARVTGHGLGANLIVGSLENTLPCSDAFLQMKAAEDPGFVDRLRWLIADAYGEEQELYRRQLLDELYDYEERHSTPEPQTKPE